MKRSGIFSLIVVVAFLIAGAIGYGSRIWSMRCESEMRLSQARRLESRHQTLRAEVDAGALQIRQLQELLCGASNRIDELVRLLDAEKKTNDPIRRQIEDMLVDQISLKTKLSDTQRRLSESERMYSALQKQVFEAKAPSENKLSK